MDIFGQPDISKTSIESPLSYRISKHYISLSIDNLGQPLVIITCVSLPEGKFLEELALGNTSQPFIFIRRDAPPT